MLVREPTHASVKSRTKWRDTPASDINLLSANWSTNTWVGKLSPYGEKAARTMDDGNESDCAMLTRLRCDAQVQIILITDDPGEALELEEAIEAMSYRIFFRSFSSAASLAAQICLLTHGSLQSLPTAIVIDYFCQARRCVDILDNLSRSLKGDAVELIVTNVPTKADIRSQLMALGARTLVSDASIDCCALSH